LIELRAGSATEFRGSLRRRAFDSRGRGGGRVARHILDRVPSESGSFISASEKHEPSERAIVIADSKRCADRTERALMVRSTTADVLVIRFRSAGFPDIKRAWDRAEDPVPSRREDRVSTRPTAKTSALAVA
jgi:hypothetical protein